MTAARAGDGVIYSAPTSHTVCTRTSISATSSGSRSPGHETCTGGFLAGARASTATTSSNSACHHAGTCASAPKAGACANTTMARAGASTTMARA